MNLLNAQSLVQDSIYKNIYEAAKNPTLIKKLDLSDQDLKTIPEEITLFKNLEYLNISNDNLKEIPQAIFHLSNLKELYASGAYSYTDKYYKENLLKEIPTEIANLKKLEVLILDHNKIEKISSSIQQLTHLKTLSLYHNEINNIEIAKISPIYSLEFLDIGGNEITQLPSNFFIFLTKLKSFYLNNQFSEGVPTGTSLDFFPKEIFSLENLENLSLSGQYLNIIPKEIKKLKKLKSLDLSANCFSELPPEIGELQNLEELNIEIICLGKLTEMKMCKKDFKIPNEFYQLKKLHTLYITTRKMNNKTLNDIKTYLPNCAIY